VLWSLYAEVFELLGRAPGGGAAFVRSHPKLCDALLLIVREEGQLWRMSSYEIVLVKDEDIEAHLGDLMKTLRDGYAHFNWRYDDCSATEYWDRMGWSTAGAPREFAIEQRTKDNYRAYIVGAHPKWDPSAFWQTKPLTLVVTRYAPLRYHLHRFLNRLLTGSELDVFGH
jgi:hypothetical protein